MVEDEENHGNGKLGGVLRDLADRIGRWWMEDEEEPQEFTER
jgi:hypothetical protein